MTTPWPSDASVFCSLRASEESSSQWPSFLKIGWFLVSKLPSMYQGREAINCLPKIAFCSSWVARRRKRRGKKTKWLLYLSGLNVYNSSVQSLSHVRLFATPWTAARQASLSITNSRSLRKLMSIQSVMPSNHLILCWPLLLPPSVFPSIRVFSNESVLCIRWPKYWSFSFSISPSNEYSGLISFRI